MVLHVLNVSSMPLVMVGVLLNVTGFGRAVVPKGGSEEPGVDGI